MAPIHKQISHWRRIPFDFSEITVNLLVTQWFATHVYISHKTAASNLSKEQMAQLTCMYISSFENFDFSSIGSDDMKPIIISKMARQRGAYDFALKPNSFPLTMNSPSYAGIGECFARICRHPDHMLFKQIGAQLFENCIGRCIEEFENKHLEFITVRVAKPVLWIN